MNDDLICELDFKFPNLAKLFFCAIDFIFKSHAKSGKESHLVLKNIEQTICEISGQLNEINKIFKKREKTLKSDFFATKTYGDIYKEILLSNINLEEQEFLKNRFKLDL